MAKQIIFVKMIFLQGRTQQTTSYHAFLILNVLFLSRQLHNDMIDNAVNYFMSIDVLIAHGKTHAHTHHWSGAAKQNRGGEKQAKQ